jgi:hypothetical protein
MVSLCMYIRTLCVCCSGLVFRIIYRRMLLYLYCSDSTKSRPLLIVITGDFDEPTSY